MVGRKEEDDDDNDGRSDGFWEGMGRNACLKKRARGAIYYVEAHTRFEDFFFLFLGGLAVWLKNAQKAEQNDRRDLPAGHRWGRPTERHEDAALIQKRRGRGVATETSNSSNNSGSKDERKPGQVGCAGDRRSATFFFCRFLFFRIAVFQHAGRKTAEGAAAEREVKSENEYY